MASCGGPLHLFLLAATSVSLAVDVNAYVYIFRDSENSGKSRVFPFFFPLFSLVSRENLHLDRSIPCIGGFSDQRTFMTCEKKSILYFTCKRVNKNENTSQDISNNSKYFNQISKNLSGKKRKHPFCPSQNKQNISTNLKTCPKVLFASRTVFS